MNDAPKKRLFNVGGALIVGIWLLLIILLIKNTHPVWDAESDTLTAATADLDSPASDWMEIFLDHKKVGYSVSHISPLEGDFLIQEELFLRMNLMGEPTDLRTVMQCDVDRDFLVKTFNYKISSGIITYEVSGNMKEGQMALKIKQGDSVRHESVKMSKRPMIGAGIFHFLKGQSLRVGRTFTLPFFDPSIMEQREVRLEIKSREKLVINRIEYDAFRLEAELFGQNLVFWLHPDGSVLKEQGFMGLTLIRSNADAARKDVGRQGGGDLYKQVAIRIKQKLSRIDRLVYLKLKLSGLEKADFDGMVLDEGRQRFEDGILEINKEVFPLEKQSDGLKPDDPSFVQYLHPEIGIESDDDEIVNKARKIVGDQIDPLKSVRMILKWVNTNIEKRPVVMPTSAKNVLISKIGDCNEHAVLMTALLRAKGIPCRICAGLTYVRGMFFYHAWCEVYVGQWITADPTLDQLPADVTHIALVKGGPASQVALIPVIGKLNMEVLAYRYQ